MKDQGARDQLGWIDRQVSCLMEARTYYQDCPVCDRRTLQIKGQREQTDTRLFRCTVCDSLLRGVWEGDICVSKVMK